jgi:hypothetical protein
MTRQRDELFRHNLELLAKHHPHVAARIGEPAPFQMEVKDTASGNANLFVQDETRAIIPLYPADDPLKGVNDFLTDLGDISGRIIAVLGVALGYYAISIIEKYGHDNVVVLYEAYPEAIEKAMKRFDLSVVLTHPNVYLVVGKIIPLKELMRQTRDIAFAVGRTKIIEFKKWTRFASHWYDIVKEQLERFAIYIGGMNMTLRHAGRRFFNNRFDNLIAIKDSFPLHSLRNRFKGKPAVVVASGPSLSNNIHKLKGFAGYSIIIAVDSAVVPLMEAGVIPDFVASMDPLEIAALKLSPAFEALKDIRFIHVPESCPQLVKSIVCKGRYFVYLGEHTREHYDALLGCQGSSLMDAQSVVHLALFSAQELGCDPIVFTGLDLAFSNNKDHAQGTVLHWGNDPLPAAETVVKDIFGNNIPTLYAFIQMLETCERLIARVPDRVYIDATEGGAKIGGTRIVPLDQVIEAFRLEKVEIPDPICVSAPPVSNLDFLENLKKFRMLVMERKELLISFEAMSDQLDEFLRYGARALCGPHEFPDSIAALWRSADQIYQEMQADRLNPFLSDLLGENNEMLMELERQCLAAKRSGTSMDAFLSQYGKQKFFQKIKAEAVQLLLEKIDHLIDAVGQLHRLEEVVASENASDQSVLSLAIFYFENGYLSAAERLLENRFVRDATALFYRGCIRVMKGQVRSGMDLLTEALRRDPSLRVKKDSFVESMTAAWQVDNGLSAYQGIMRRRLIELAPSPDVLEKQWLQDLSYAKQSLAVKPSNEVYISQVRDLMEDWKSFRLRLPEWHSLRALLLKAESGLDSAIAYLKEMTVANPGAYADCEGLLARLLIEDKRFTEGLEQLQVAVELDPRAAALWEEIGDMLLASGDIPGAVLAYENCLRALTDNMEVMGKIGDCYLVDGKRQAAALAYQLVLDKDPDNPRALAGISRLKGSL